MASAGTAYVDVEAKVDELASSIDDAISSIDTQTIDVQAEVTANTDEVQGELDSLSASDVEVMVEADAAGAQSEIDAIDGGEAEIEVQADTSAASANVEELADSLSDLGGGGPGGEAIGSMEVLGAGLAGAATGAAAAGAGLYAVASAGIEAAGAAERFDMIAGSMGDDLMSIDVGGLSGDIGELALKLGSSDEAMLNATASFVTFAESTGAGREEITAASDNINALALRAVALNPGLGDAGAVAERLATSLARGGRATTAFGIGLTSAEINARALSNTGKENVADLTQFEKAAAGAQIAVERLGMSMGEDFEDGANNAQTQWNRMTESIGEATEALAGRMMPAIANITEGVTDLATGISEMDFGSLIGGLWEVSSPGLFVNGLTDLYSAIFNGNDKMNAQGQLVGELADQYGEAAGAADDLSGSVDDVAQSYDKLNERIRNYLDGVLTLPEAERGMREAWASLNETLASGTASYDDIAVGLEDIVTQTAAVGLATGDMGAAVAEARFGLSVLASTGALSADQIAIVDGYLAGLEARAPFVYPVSTPGATQSAGEVKAVDDAVRKVPPSWMTTISVPGATNATGVVRTHDGAVRSVPTGWTTNFVANTGTAQGNINALISRIQALNSAVASMPSTNSIAAQVGAMNAALAGGRARGGPVDGGKIYLVGEQGPELVVPRSAGTVVPAPQTAAILGQGAGATYNVTVIAPTGDGDDIARAVREELIKLERSDR